MKISKKILSIFLAVSIMLSLAVPVFATDNVADYELIPYEGMDFSDALISRAFGDDLYYRELDEKIYSFSKLDSGKYALIELATGEVVVEEVEYNGQKYIPTDVVKFDNELNYLAHTDIQETHANFIIDSTEGKAIIDKNGEVLTAFEEENVYRLFVLSKDVIIIYDNDLEKDRLKNIRTNQTVGITGMADVFNAHTFAKHGTFIKKSDNKYYYVSPEGVISNTGISMNNCEIGAPLGENLWEISKDYMCGAMDRTGNVVIPVEYLQILPVGNDVYLVSSDEGIKYINGRNEIVQNPDIEEDSDVYYDNNGEIRDAMTGELLLDSKAEGLECYVVGDNADLLVAKKEGKWYRVVLKPDSQKSEITGVTLSDAEYTYDGTEKSIAVSGSLPEGAVVTYAGEKATNAGTYNATATITADGYKPLVLRATMKINPAPITVTADSHNVILGDELPELTYKVTSGTLAEGDSFAGKLSTNARATREGTYDVLQGTLKLNSNYKLTFVNGTITISEKMPQNITVSEVGAKIYGDESFAVTATADEKAKLSNFTYESSNTSVATIAADGTVTIVGAGETEITVKEPGNDIYASFEKSQTLVVEPKEVSVEVIELDTKTATLAGVLAGDAEFVDLDFDKLMLELADSEEGASEIAVIATNFVLKGEKAANYKVTTEEIETTVSVENIATVSVIAENGTVSGVGTYLVGSEVNLVATADSRYEFDGWFVGEELVSEEAEYSFVLEADIELTAKFKKTGGHGGLVAGEGSNNKKEEEKEPEKTDDPDVFVPQTPDVSEKFTDIDGYAWAEEAIVTLVEKGIIKGTSENTYSPSANIIRADYVALVVRMFNLTSANEENFADVNPSDYFASELAIARNNGIVGGVGDNMFNPRGNITRQDMMVMLYRAMTKLGIELEETGEVNASDFDDVAEYAKDAVSVLVANGIINGKNGKIDPMATATRAEVAVMLSRVLEFIK